MEKKINKFIYIIILVSCITNLYGVNKYRAIPSNNNWRSDQFTDYVMFKKFVKKHNIKTVIKLNGERSFGMTERTEKLWCKLLKINYVKGSGETVDGAKKINKILKQGNCLIHCKWGFDRTGAVVGYYLRMLGWTAKDIIKHNNWHNYIKKKGKSYKKYWDIALKN